MTETRISERALKKGLSILIALLFLFNLFSVIPQSTQHSKIDGVTHTISAEMAKADEIQAKTQHDNIEHCGVSSCTFAFQNSRDLVVVSDAEITLFSTLIKDLVSVFHAPLGRPPLV
ncbi:MAG: hypothetical protein V7750_17880 [Sneathiella sp.]